MHQIHQAESLKDLMHPTQLYPTSRYSSKPFRGFEKKYSRDLNEDRKNEFRDEICNWTERQIKTTMGFINAITFSVAEKAGAIQLNSEGKRRLIPQRIKRLCRYGCWQLYTTVKGIAKYISDWWDGVIQWNEAKDDGDRRSIRKVRDTLTGMGLLRFKQLQSQQRSWQTFSDIDFGGLLMLYEMLEEALLDDRLCDFSEDLPEHKGALVRAFYNVCEEMLGVFRRSGGSIEESKEDEPANPTKPFVCKYTIDGEEFDANFYNRQGVSLRDIVFAEKARLEKLRKGNSQNAKKQWFDSVSYRPECDLPY